jgi:hypothetical protein
MCKCILCGNEFQGDKRAMECLECAVSLTKQFDRPAIGEGSRVEGDEIEIVARAMAVRGYARMNRLDPDHEKIDGTDHFERWYQPDKKAYLEDAEAALSALRSPSEAARLRFTNEWLKERIRSDGDCEVEAGYATPEPPHPVAYEYVLNGQMPIVTHGKPDANRPSVTQIRPLYASSPDGELVRKAAGELLERLDQFERGIDDIDDEREYLGHVKPAAARLRAALSAREAK